MEIDVGFLLCRAHAQHVFEFIARFQPWLRRLRKLDDITCASGSRIATLFKNGSAHRRDGENRGQFESADEAAGEFKARAARRRVLQIGKLGLAARLVEGRY